MTCSPMTPSASSAGSVRTCWAAQLVALLRRELFDLALKPIENVGIRPPQRVQRYLAAANEKNRGSGWD